MGIGADQRVGIGDDAAILLRGPDGLGEVFEIDLVADAGARRHDAEIVEGLLAPAQELVALAVALIFALDIALERLRVAEMVDHHRVVDDEIDRHERIDPLRVAAERGHGVPHRGKVDDRGHAGEVLHQHARRAEGYLALQRTLLQPNYRGRDIVAGDGAAVLVAEEVLDQHLQRERQPREPGKAVLLRGGKAEIVVVAAGHGQGPACGETVEGRRFAQWALLTNGAGG